MVRRIPGLHLCQWAHSRLKLCVSGAGVSCNRDENEELKNESTLCSVKKEEGARKG